MNNLKSIITQISLIILSILFTSCEKTPELIPELTLAKQELNFGKSSSTTILAIKSNINWTTASTQTWCTLSPSEGEAGTHQITVAVAENATSEPREAIITITAGELSKQVKVTQELTNNLTVSQKEFSFTDIASEMNLTIESVLEYTTSIQADWITLKNTSSDKKMQTFSIADNNTANARTSTITFTSGTLTETVTILQAAKSLYIPANATGMNSTATELAKKLKVGINIGNTMEATGGETGWGNPLITNDLIQAFKQNGFNAIRLPVAWNQYADQTTSKISAVWLNRVRQVVQYCVDNDMYVLVNIHWDGGWLENNCTEAKMVENNAKQKIFWEQIAVSLRDYDEHVLFASANEPNVDNATQMNVLNSYHQTFVDAVRSTGGRNAYRTLVIQGPSTDITKTNQLMTKMPTDKVPNKMMAEVHYYTPWNFCGMEKDETWGNIFYYWGKDNHSTTDTGHNATYGEEAELDRLFKLMKVKFADKGIPVILGEFGAMRRNMLTGDNLTKHLASRAYFYEYVAKQAKNNGMIPFLWDTGIHNNNDMGIIDRKTGVASDDQAYKALIKGATDGVYPF